MSAVAQAVAFAGVALSALGVEGCTSTADPVGTYYAFVGEKPTTNEFTYEHVPVATLTFLDGRRWRITVIMAEDLPMEGTWSRDGNELDLKWSVGVSMKGTLLEDGYIVAGLEGQQPFHYWKMPEAWEASMRSTGSNDAIMQQARDIGKAAVMLAGDNDDTLPKTRAELVEGLGMFLADPTILESFEYTFPGGKLPPEKERGTTPLGKLTVAGKVVVIYLDGDAR